MTKKSIKPENDKNNIARIGNTETQTPDLFNDVWQKYNLDSIAKDNKTKKENQ